jgi:hypothetical protein
LTIRSSPNEKDEHYNFDDDFGSTFTVRQELLQQKQQKQFSNPPFNSHQVFGNQRHERNFSHSQFQSNFRFEPPEQPSFPTRGPEQVESIFRQTDNLSQKSQLRNYQLVKNSRNNNQRFSGNSSSFNGSSSSSQQLSSYWSESQQILRNTNSSCSVSNNLAYRINDNGNNIDNNNNNNNSSNSSDIAAYQPTSSLMNSYTTSKNW